MVIRAKWMSIIVSLGLFFGQAVVARPADVNERMEQVRRMFSSPYSEEDYYRTDRLLVSATGSLVPVFKAPSVASVITREDIRAMGARTLDEVLETVPGLHVGASGPGLLNPIYSIRGIHTHLNPQTLLLYNGIPFQTPNSGSRVYVFRLPVEYISRVEVVRGPGSAVHGADAFAGTINIITKDGFEIDGSRAGIRAGSFATYDAWLQHGGQYGGWNASCSLEMMRSDGDDDRIIAEDVLKVNGLPGSVAPGPLDTDYDLYDFNLGLTKGNWSLKFWLLAENDAGGGAGAANALAPGNRIDFEQYLLDLKYNNNELWKDWDVTLGLHYVHLQVDPFYQLLPAGAVVPVDASGNIGANPNGLPSGLVLFTGGSFGNPQIVDRTGSFNLEGFYTGIRRHRLRLGGGVTVQDEETSQFKNNGPGVIDPSAPGWVPFGAGVNLQGPALVDVSDSRWVWLSDNSRTIWNMFFQDEWAVATRWDLVAGVRYDHYSDFGDTVNPRAALVWETRPDLTSKLMYGRAFRPPNFSELYARNNPSVIGNSSLDPETIDVWELAFDYQPSPVLRGIVSLFTYQIEDLIEFVEDPAPATTSTARNSKNQDGHGVEIEVRWQVNEDLALKGNWSLQRSTDEQTDEVVVGPPARQWYLNAHYRLTHRWTIDAAYHRVADRHRNSDDSRPEIGDYDKVDLTLRYRSASGRWQAALAARNLLDDDIREPGGPAVPGDYPMEGRSIWGELRFHFP